MLSINTNVNALYAQLALQQHTQEINQLTKILIDANGGGSAGADLNNVSASVVPTYLTTSIRGTSQAMSNTGKAIELVGKEGNTLDSITQALNTMQSNADIVNTYNDAKINNYYNPYTAAQSAEAQSQFDYAKASISTYISGNSYNGKDLSNGTTLGFQVGDNANEKISFTLPDLTHSTSDTAQNLSAVTNATFTTSDPNLQTTIDTALAAVNRDNGSVKAMISRLGFVQSWLQTDLNRSTDYRSTLLSHAVTSAQTQVAVQEILKNAAQAILAQANVSNQGIIDLIASANIPVH